MTDKSVYGGLFQDPPFLSSDPDPSKSDPYDKQESIPSRYLGKTLLTGGAACPGQHPDGYLDKKYLTLASDEQNAEVYAANDKSARRRAAAAKKRPVKPISESEFRYASFPSKSTGPGSYYGCIQSRPYEHDVDPAAHATKQELRRRQQREKAAAAAEEEEKRIRALPNIRTNPPKKGTYGVPGTLLTKEVYNDNWRADREADEKRLRKAAAAAGAAEGSASRSPDVPFRVPGVSKTYLDELPGTGVSGIYTTYTPLEVPTRGKGARRSQRPAAEAAPIHNKPFYSGNASVSRNGCINPFPNTWVDPAVAAAEESKRAKRRRNKEQAAPPPTRPKGAEDWKPNSFGHTSIISSCLRRFY